MNKDLGIVGYFLATGGMLIIPKEGNQFIWSTNPQWINEIRIVDGKEVLVAGHNVNCIVTVVYEHGS